MAQYVAITGLNRSAKVRVPGQVLAETAVNEVQTLSTSGTPTGGTFTLTYEGQTTGAIAYNAAAAAVVTALDALPNIAPGDVTGGGGPLPTAVTLTFAGAGTTAAREISPITASGSFTGGTNPAVAVAETTKGQAAVTAVGTAAAPVPITLQPGRIVVVNVDDAATRKALNAHRAIGQWIVVGANDFVGVTAIPTNT